MKHHNGSSITPPLAMARSMRQLAHDVVELAELQTSMVQLELQGWWKQLIMPAVLLVVAAVFAISCIPVLTVAAAYGLNAWLSLGMGWSLLIAAGIALLLAVITGWLGMSKLKAAHAPLQESRRELSQNVRWIKSVLQHHARPAKVLRSTHETN